MQSIKKSTKIKVFCVTGMLNVFIFISTTYYGNGYKEVFLNLLSAFSTITSIIVICTSLASNQIELGKNILPSSATMTCSKIVYNKKIIYLFLISNPSV